MQWKISLDAWLVIRSVVNSMGVLWGSKKSQFDRKSWFFTNAVMYIVPNPQISIKTDLNGWN